MPFDIDLLDWHMNKLSVCIIIYILYYTLCQHMIFCKQFTGEKTKRWTTFSHPMNVLYFVCDNIVGYHKYVNSSSEASVMRRRKLGNIEVMIRY